MGIHVVLQLLLDHLRGEKEGQLAKLRQLVRVENSGAAVMLELLGGDIDDHDFVGRLDEALRDEFS